MQIKYSITEKDYNRFNKYLLLTGIRARVGIHTAVIIILVFCCFNGGSNWLNSVFFFLAFVIAYFALLFFIPYYLAKRKLRQSINAEPSALEEKQLTVLDDGLLIESVSRSITWRWASMSRAEASDEYIFITMADKRYLLFPKASFASGADVIAFLGMIQLKIHGFQIAGINTLKAPSRPPYLLGLICIIPLVGAFVGLALILYGILKYKDKWLIVIGLAGILWSVGVYGSLFWYSKHGDFPKQSMKIFAQADLNNLVKQIEFYKIEHGVYPDSLQQLKTKDDFLSITDPSQSFLGNKKAVYYNYKRLDNHYYLFSSGPDGVPNTADDIYPNLTIADSSKIGLIIKKGP